MLDRAHAHAKIPGHSFSKSVTLALTHARLFFVPQCLSTATQNRNASAGEIRAAAPDLQAFIDRLSKLAVVVFCGRTAQRAKSLVSLPPGVQVLETFHPAARSYNQAKYRNDIHEKFKQAARVIAERVAN
jgi:uracil-DNA glycosylase